MARGGSRARDGRGIERDSARGGNTRTATAGDPTNRLPKPKKLHDEGLFTEGEFRAKRAQILKEM
jgi:hypothetical protein